MTIAANRLILVESNNLSDLAPSYLSDAVKKKTQTSQVIEALRAEGGFATFKRLNEVLDFSSWGTQTPEASVRRIVQNSPLIFRIRPGLWALEESRADVLRKFNLQIGNPKSEERFSHAYYQGLIVEIGKFRRKTTYIPAQDQNKLFLGRRLAEVSDIVDIPPFTYPDLLRRAKTVDVVWFNERRMPVAFYEVEHTTDIKNSLSKFSNSKTSTPGFSSWPTNADAANMRQRFLLRCSLL